MGAYICGRPPQGAPPKCCTVLRLRRFLTFAERRNDLIREDSVIDYFRILPLWQNSEVIDGAVFACKNRLRHSRERASQNLEVIQFIFSIHSLLTIRIYLVPTLSDSGNFAHLQQTVNQFPHRGRLDSGMIIELPR